MLLYWSDKMIQQEIERQISQEYLRELKEVPRSTRKRLTERQEALIRERISKLPREEMLAVYLYFWEGSTTREIAKVLSLSVGLTAKLINNALVRLRDDLQTLVPGNNGKMEMEAVA